MKIFFSVGEPSGDLHGANLIRELRTRRPDLELVGYGGPRMAAAGCQLHEDLTQLAVMWFARVLIHLHRFWDLVSRADRYFRHQRPDAVVMIDYPGFNWWIARRAKVHGIPVFYYGTPQLWGWAGWRIHKMRRLVDHLLCKLPFEENWYRERGCQATFVGHPYFDQLSGEQLDEAFIADQQRRPGPLIAVLPGSRTQEVKQNLPGLLQAAEKVRAAVPEARFAIAAFREQHLRLIDAQLRASQLQVSVYVGRTGELIRASECAMAVSGSVSLELLYHTKPAVILYQISPLAYQVQKVFRKVRYITLVNLLTVNDADRFPARVAPYDPQDPVDAHVLMPEYLTCEDRSSQIAEHLVSWLKDSTLRQRRIDALEQLKQQVAQGGASCRAAQYIVERLQTVTRSRRLRTHGDFRVPRAELQRDAA